MTENNLPATQALSVTNFELAQREAKLLSISSIIPTHYQNNIGNCYVAIHAAKNLGLDPLMLMQRSYVLHGKIGLEGQLVIALVNAKGPYAKRLDWKFEGKEGTDTYKCTCLGFKEDGTFDSVSLTIKDIKALGWWKNDKWQNMTDQMFCYRTATFLARRYCPEVLMGFSTDDELKDVGASVSVEAGPSAKLNEALKLTAQPEPETITVTVSEVEPEESPL